MWWIEWGSGFVVAFCKETVLLTVGGRRGGERGGSDGGGPGREGGRERGGRLLSDGEDDECAGDEEI